MWPVGSMIHDLQPFNSLHLQKAQKAMNQKQESGCFDITRIF